MEKVEIPDFFYSLAVYLYMREPLISIFLINCNYILDEDGLYLKDGLVGVINKTNKTYLFFKSELFFRYSKEELFFIVLHEAEHVFKRHIDINKKQYETNPLVSNLSEDCIINSEIREIEFNEIKPTPPAGCFFVPTTYKIENRDQVKLGFSSQKLFSWFIEKNKCFNESFDEKSNRSLPFYFMVQEKIGNIFGDFYRAKISNGKMIIQQSETIVLKNIEEFDKSYVMYLDPTDLRFGIERKWLRNYYFKETHLSEKEEDDFFNNNDSSDDRQITIQKMIYLAEQISLDKNNHFGKSNYLIKTKEKINDLGIDWRKKLNKNINNYVSKNKSRKKIIKSYFSWLKNPKSNYDIIAKANRIKKEKLSPFVFVGIDTSATVANDQDLMSSIFGELHRLNNFLKFNLKGKVLMFQWAEKIIKMPEEFNINIEIIGGGGTNPDCFKELIKNKEKQFYINYMEKNSKQKYFFNEQEPPLLILITDGLFKKSSLKDIGIYEKRKDRFLIVSKQKDNIRKDLEIIVI